MIITSFSKQGYEKYGKRFIESYYECENTHSLTVYYEEEKPEIEHDGLNYIHLFECEGVLDTLDQLKMDRSFKGIVLTKDEDGKQKEAYNWRYDAYKFARKVLAIGDYYIKVNEAKDKFIWLDADIIFKDKLPDNFMDLVVPDSVGVSHIGRLNMHSECGFIGFNSNFTGFQRFFSIYWGLYVTGAFAYCREWHDSYLFDHALVLGLMKAYSLSGDSDSMYPFDDTILHQWMEHNKGPERKAKIYENAA